MRQNLEKLRMPQNRETCSCQIMNLQKLSFLKRIVTFSHQTRSRGASTIFRWYNVVSHLSQSSLKHNAKEWLRDLQPWHAPHR